MTSVERILLTASRKTSDGLLVEVVSLHPHDQTMCYSFELPDEDISKEGYRRLIEALGYDGWHFLGEQWARKEDMTKIGELVSAMSRGEAFMKVYGEMKNYGSQTAVNFSPEKFLERVKRAERDTWETDTTSLLTALGFTIAETPYCVSVAEKSKEMALPK